MDAQHSGEIYRHLEKQGELLEEARKSIMYELQKLAVEQEMLMRKSYDVRMQQEHARKNKEHDGLQDNADVKQAIAPDGAAMNISGSESRMDIAVVGSMINE